MGRKEKKIKKFEEISHTADAAVLVFGENKVELFTNAIQGMYHLMGLKLNEDEGAENSKIDLNENDLETLLVSFLTEILISVEKGIGFKEFDIEIENTALKGKMSGYTVDSYDIQIKAVTFNELKIKKENSILSTEIVFDV